MRLFFKSETYLHDAKPYFLQLLYKLITNFRLKLEFISIQLKPIFKKVY